MVPFRLLLPRRATSIDNPALIKPPRLAAGVPRVLGEAKRRRLSIYTLPIVVLIGFLLVAKLAAWQRSDLIAELTDCIHHGETPEAVDAVLKLSALPHPPIPTLVSAAAADEHETAEAGQVAISRLLRKWQRDIETKHREPAVAGELSEMAKSLAKQLGDFSDSDRPWLAETTHKIVRLGNQLPPTTTPLVAMHCDAILRHVGDPAAENAAHLRTASVSSASIVAEAAMPSSNAASAAIGNNEMRSTKTPDPNKDASALDLKGSFAKRTGTTSKPDDNADALGASVPTKTNDIEASASPREDSSATSAPR